MELRQVVVQHDIQIEHPDRVSWYQSLLQEWTGQVPQVFVQADGMVAAWVMGYHSQAGFVHIGPTQVWSDTIENALDALSCQVYADVQADFALLAGHAQSHNAALAVVSSRS